LLNQLPTPTEEDVAARMRREPMDGGQRLRFVKEFFLGLVMLLAVYFFLTAFRDFRDNFGQEIITELGLADRPAIFTTTEFCVAIPVMLAMAALNLVKDNRRGLLGAFVIMIMGFAIMGGGTLLLDAGLISGFWWVVLIGLGVFFPYVPFNSMLFDRMIAMTRFTGTAVFAIYLADSLGYTGSLGMLLYKDLGQSEMSRLAFLRWFSYLLSGFGMTMLMGSCWYFMRKKVG
jgi:Family of unknown function (DUF5690)